MASAMFLPAQTLLWEDPALLGISKLPPRASFEERPDGSVGSENPWALPLDGQWNFCTFDSVEEAWCAATEPPCGKNWASVMVPGHPELQGFGAPHYTNVQMPFSCQPPTVPKVNPTGVFRRTVRVPESWAGLRTVIHFGSAESFLAVWINGQFAGMSKGSRTPAEFEIGRFVEAGNEIEVVALVAKWSDANFIEDQDMWWMSGLPRTVRLQASRSAHIADLKVHADPLAKGISVDASIVHPIESSVRVLAVLKDPDGQTVGSSPIELVSKESNRAREEFQGFLPVEHPRLWSAEAPDLYTVHFTMDAAGESSTACIRTGFRTVEVREGALLINGRRVLIFGVNRHSHSPTRGRAVTFEEMLEDIRLIKRFHFNAVRCSHYPPDPLWLDLCDEHGLYVIDEADIESHAFATSLSNDPCYATAFLDRTMRMVARDRNHPSVILWSLGNESGYGASHDAAAGWVRHADPSRPLHYEGAISRSTQNSILHGSAASDIVCPMYPSIEDLVAMEKILEANSEPQDGRTIWERIRTSESILPFRRHPQFTAPARDPLPPGNRPIIMCEYSHAMGNSNGSLADYFRLFRSSRRIQGGFIWEWCDHGILQKDGGWAYGGDFGESPHDGNFCCDGLVSPDRKPHPALFEHWHLAQPVWIDSRFQLQNRQDFTGLDWIDAEWTRLINGEPVESGKIDLPAVPPGAVAQLDKPQFSDSRGEESGFLVRFKARERHGFWNEGDLVGMNYIPLHRVPPSFPAQIRAKPAGLSSTEDAVFFESPLGRIRICRKSGRLVGAETGNTSLCGPIGSLWRAATDNDGIKLWTGQSGKPLGRWLALGLDKMQSRPLECVLSETDSGLLIRTSEALSGRDRWNDAILDTEFQVFDGDCWVFHHRMRLLAEDLTDLPRIGCRWHVPMEFLKARYFGLGPHENYPDRCDSAYPACHPLDPCEPCPYVMPQEYGLRGGLRWLELKSPNGRIRWEAGGDLAFSLLQHSPESLFAATHGHEIVPLSHLVLSLDAAHHGLGTGSCGPDTREEYRISGREFAWSYTVRLSA